MQTITLSHLNRLLFNASNTLIKRDFAPVMKKWATVMKADVDKNFANESSAGNTPDGGLWPSLAESTKEKKITKSSKRGGSNILAPRGKRGMFGSIQSASDNSRVYIGTNKKKDGIAYPMFHQTGTRKMPQRVFLAVDPENIIRMQSDLWKHLFGLSGGK